MKKKKKPPKLVQILVSILFLIGLLWGGKEGLRSPEIVSSKQPITLHATQCQDDLRKLFLEAIGQAKESIFVVIYALNDQKLIDALNKKASEGLSISVYHDTSTSQTGFHKLLPPIQVTPIAVKGLAHQKILITDSSKVWIGSANWTPDSLRVHANLVVGIESKLLASYIQHPEGSNHFTLNQQNMEFWRFPEEGKDGLARMISLLDTAQKTIRVAMYTWTHPGLTDAIIRAHKRGVDVEAVIDHSSGQGVSKQTFQTLFKAGVPVSLSSGRELFHHKFAWIDGKILMHGSTNWTRSAFSRNSDCLLILSPLTEEQEQKMGKLWRVIQTTTSGANAAFLEKAA